MQLTVSPRFQGKPQFSAFPAQTAPRFGATPEPPNPKEDLIPRLIAQKPRQFKIVLATAAASLLALTAAAGGNWLFNQFSEGAFGDYKNEAQAVRSLTDNNQLQKQLGDTQIAFFPNQYGKVTFAQIDFDNYKPHFAWGARYNRNWDKINELLGGPHSKSAYWGRVGTLNVKRQAFESLEAYCKRTEELAKAVTPLLFPESHPSEK